MNPIVMTSLGQKEEKESDRPKEMLQQVEIPWRKKEHRFDPMFFKCDGKIVKYESKDLKIWGALVSFSHTLLSDWDTWNHLTMLKELHLRLCRLCFQLTFLAVQGDGELQHLVDKGLLTEKEKTCLDAATIGTRPLVVVDWLYAFYYEIRPKYPYTDPMEVQIHTNFQSLRGGIGATLGAIGAQLPYPYVHCVYWTIQILLLALAVETGVWLGTDIWMKSNGSGEWSPPDDTAEWPVNPNVWYANAFLQITASNIIFALFCEGMLKICDKLANPMSKDDTSFSETVYDAFMYNNCRALKFGFDSFHDVFAADVMLLKKK